MTTNEKIAKWLGCITFYINHASNSVIEKIGTGLFAKKSENDTCFKVDFLHDRNQQKWIEDELIKKGYMVVKVLEKENAFVRLAKVKQDIKNFFESIEKENDKPDLDTAFIEAVMQLIDKETQSSTNCVQLKNKEKK
jgi:hypothetical protein